ncbi:MAG: DUF3426 domain-containing protein [Spongiibacteraceae bacterium]|nr:DUF3426 domain-containing protein [Spongiibacteraceae bacterium]
MTSQVTQCPNCNTSFRVTETQLHIANGSVRCGSCLHIFNAPDHWLGSDTTPTSAPNFTDEFDDKKLYNDTDELLALNRIFDEDDLQAVDDKLAFDIDKKDEKVSPPTAIEEQDEDNDDDDDYDIFIDDDDVRFGDSGAVKQSVIEEGMISAEHLNPPAETTSTSNDFSKTFLDLDTWEESPTTIFKELDDLGSTEETEEKQWTEKLLEEDRVDEQAPGDSEPFEEMPDLFDSLDDSDQEQATQFDIDIIDPFDEMDQSELKSSTPVDEFILGDESMLAGEPIGNSNYALLANIEPEPVVIMGKMKQTNWVKRAWMASIVIAVLAVGTQYLIFNFDRLSRDSQWRPLLGSACKLFACQLPDRDNIKLIKSSNLVVRSHPDVADALVVDAIITNRADFEQRFPFMELQFTDLSGSVIAGRRFAPEEYLAGELTGANMMPVRQPIHISLEIVDPGQKAVNYQLYFHLRRDG